ncbi:MAG: nucleotidyltransferase domain-containing protein [Bacillota bacterium]
MEIFEELREMTNTIVRNFAPDKIILFGSRARGLVNADSDVDFLVVMEYGTSKRDAQLAIKKKLRQFAIPQDVLVISQKELDKYQNLRGLIYGIAVREGKILYERAS